MADEKISLLPAAGTLDGTEPVPVVKGGVTSQTTTQEIADLGNQLSPDELDAVQGANAPDAANPFATIADIVAGGGNVVGPGSSIDNNVAFFNGITGKIIKDNGITLTGTNTGDNATNTQYSGLASSKEDTANKSTSTGDIASNVKFPVWSAVVSYVTGLGYLLATTAASTYQAILTDVNFGAFINSLTSKTTPIDADSVSIVDSADSNKQKKVSLTNFKAFLKTYFDTLYSIKAFVEEISIQDISTSLPASTYTPIQKAKYARTINEITVKLTAGTCTMDVNINGTPVTGLSTLSITSTEQTFTATALNNIAVNDLVTVVTTANSGVSNLRVIIKTTR